MIFSRDAALASTIEWRQKVWQNHFRPVPINNGSKFPRQIDWQILARQEPPWACVNVHPWQLGSGILTDGLRPIDGDLDDPDQATALDRYIADNLEPAPYRFRHGSPRRLYLYRADEGEPGKSFERHQLTKEQRDAGMKAPGVEVLGKGNQFFADGIHPESGERLQWTISPTEIHRDDLPALTDQQTENLLDFVADLIGSTRRCFRPSDEPMPVRNMTGEEWPIGDLRDTLQVAPCPDDYDTWFMLSCAVYDACGGSSEGFFAWQSWCSNGPNYDDRACGRLWRSLGNSPTYYSAGTLLHEARSHHHGWERPSLSMPVEFFLATRINNGTQT